MSNFSRPDKVTGKSSDDYNVLELLGKGGNAEVYRCVNEAISIEYAIKFQIRLNRNRPDRFNKEIKLNEEIGSHEHLIKYIDSGKYDEHPFIIMDIAEKKLNRTI